MQALMFVAGLIVGALLGKLFRVIIYVDSAPTQLERLEEQRRMGNRSGLGW